MVGNKQENKMMRKSVMLLCSVLWLLPVCAIGQDLISFPESAAFDTASNRYFISNQGSGTIVQIDSNWEYSYFSTGLTTPKGLKIVGDTLFVAAGTHAFLAFDLNTGARILTVQFPGQVDLNDVETDTSGNVYVSDAQGNQIHKLKLSDLSTSTIVTGITMANGLLFDERQNRLLVCQWIQNSPISAIDLETYSLTPIVNDGLDLLDGLTEDNEGHIYVSSFGTDKIYRYDAHLSSPPEVASATHVDPGDIYYNKRDDILVVPNVTGNRVDFVTLTDLLYDPDRDSLPSDDDNCPVDFNPEQTDTDGDEIGNACDNCPGKSNPDQTDIDNDAIGDACDICTDTDGDGYGNPGHPANVCAEDNCPDESNPDQADDDNDDIGNVCDDCTDTDEDGYGNPDYPANTCAEDNCPNRYNPNQEDSDSDGVGDTCDNCPEDLNPDQADADDDGLGDICDSCTDTDEDGYGDPGYSGNLCGEDNCPETYNPDQTEVERGDINCKDGINVLDVLSVVNHILGTTYLIGGPLERADCNGDGRVNIVDALGIINVILGIGECAPAASKPIITSGVLEFIESLKLHLPEKDFAQLMKLVEAATHLPGESFLSQNYPNPFNPSTEISYHIADEPSPVHTTLTIYDILGHEVRTLVDDLKEPGQYTARWDGRDRDGFEVTSGLYFCQLRAETFRATKRLLLLK